jgi:protein-disulfide isomerase
MTSKWQSRLSLTWPKEPGFSELNKGTSMSYPKTAQSRRTGPANNNIRRAAVVCMMALLLIFGSLRPGRAGLEWRVDKTFRFKTPPIDMAVSSKGNWIFTLIEGGIVEVYDAKGQLAGKIDAGDDIDQIGIGPREDLLVVKSRKNKTVQVLVLEFIQNIDIVGSPFKGPADAPVTIIVFSDFQCVYCARLVPMIDEVLEAYPKTVKVVYKHFPLKSHKLARPAAQAAVAADQQERFWAFHDQLYAEQAAISKAGIVAIADGLGLDRQKFDTALNSPASAARVFNDQQAGIRAGVRGTPTVFINGRKLKDRTLKGFLRMIEQEIENQPASP